MINSFKITWKTHIRIISGTYIFALVFNNIINPILDKFLLNEFIFYPTKHIILNFYIYVFLLLIPISIIHEGIHGLTYKLFGGKVKFGFKYIYAYTQEISGIPIERDNFLIVLLMPLTIISILCVCIPDKIGSIIFLLNLLGSSGDVYMALTLKKYDSNSKIIDKAYGYDVINSELHN